MIVKRYPDAMDAERTVIVKASLHNPAPEFVGEFGLGNPRGFQRGSVNPTWSTIKKRTQQ